MIFHNNTTKFGLVTQYKINTFEIPTLIGWASRLSEMTCYSRISIKEWVYITVKEIIYFFHVDLSVNKLLYWAALTLYWNRLWSHWSKSIHFEMVMLWMHIFARSNKTKLKVDEVLHISVHFFTANIIKPCTHVRDPRKCYNIKCITLIVRTSSKTFAYL